MALVNIQQLLDTYFDGNTTLEEEVLLKEYFESDAVAPKHEMYKPLFMGFAQAATEKSQRHFKIPESKGFSFKAWSSIAAIALVLVTTASIYFTQPKLSTEEKEALAAFEQAQGTLMLLSKNLNKGTEGLSYMNHFTKGVENLTILNQFTETKNRILK